MSLGFLGEYQHSLDAKGRVILPAEFREPLAEGAVLTRVLDGCLAVYSREGFEEMAEQVRENARQRASANGAPLGPGSAPPDRSHRTSRGGSPSRRPCVSTPASSAT